jgi:regulator of nucleoside diphosphate kinase
MSQALYIMKEDKEKLLELIDRSDDQEARMGLHLKALRSEINKARVIDREESAHRFVKVNSKVLLMIDQEEEELTLVYPQEADRKSNKISVLSPIGTAILGYSEGSSVEWNVPSGTVHIQIKKIYE